MHASPQQEGGKDAFGVLRWAKWGGKRSNRHSRAGWVSMVPQARMKQVERGGCGEKAEARLSATPRRLSGVTN